VADGGGARPESARERGLPVVAGGGLGAGSGGEARALKRKGRRATGFEAQTGKPSTILVLRLNQETHASGLHVPGADRTRHHPTSRPPRHRVSDLCGHPWSSALGLLLLPRSSSLYAIPHLPSAHHETSKRDSPNETKVKEKQNKTIPNSNSNLTKSMTRHTQTKNRLLGFSEKLSCGKHSALRYFYTPRVVRVGQIEDFWSGRRRRLFNACHSFDYRL
jgi:hypothetical protein